MGRSINKSGDDPRIFFMPPVQRAYLVLQRRQQIQELLSGRPGDVNGFFQPRFDFLDAIFDHIVWQVFGETSVTISDSTRVPEFRKLIQLIWFACDQ